MISLKGGTHRSRRSILMYKLANCSIARARAWFIWPDSRFNASPKRAAFAKALRTRFRLQVLDGLAARPIGRQGRPRKKFLPPPMSERIRATVTVRYCTRKPSVIRIDFDYPLATLASSRLMRVGGRP